MKPYLSKSYQVMHSTVPRSHIISVPILNKIWFLGVLNGCIEVHGDWLPRHIFGKCTALCAIIRMLYLSLVVIYRQFLQQFKESFSKSQVSVPKNKDEIVFVDGVSAPLPLFFLAGIPTIFYCHFPDKVNFVMISIVFCIVCVDCVNWH